jgi:hypothetical protein
LTAPRIALTFCVVGAAVRELRDAGWVFPYAYLVFVFR